MVSKLIIGLSAIIKHCIQYVCVTCSLCTYSPLLRVCLWGINCVLKEWVVSVSGQMPQNLACLSLALVRKQLQSMAFHNLCKTLCSFVCLPLLFSLCRLFFLQCESHYTLLSICHTVCMAFFWSSLFILWISFILSIHVCHTLMIPQTICSEMKCGVLHRFSIALL